MAKRFLILILIIPVVAVSIAQNMFHPIIWVITGKDIIEQETLFDKLYKYIRK